MMIVGSKIIISSDKHVLDTTSKVLPPGVYTYIVDSFGTGEVVRGRISENPGMGVFKFKSFTLIKLMAKAQSYMFRRMNRNRPICAEVSNHPSPSNSPYRRSNKRLSRNNAASKYLSRNIPRSIPRNLVSPIRRREETCAICLEKCSTKLAKCGHYFHRACINTWRRRSIRCPICRGRIRSCPKMVAGSPLNVSNSNNRIRSHSENISNSHNRVRSYSENVYLPSIS